MQKLEERNTYTPTNIPHIRCNCGLVLNREETLSVPNLKTSSNSSDAALTAERHAGQDLRVPAVYVLSMRGPPLMPTTPQKARKLLRESKAKVVKRTPFTIQLKIATGETKQRISLGVDSGYTEVGLSAVTDKKELYSAKAKLRTDIVKLNSERKEYRRSRRHRKTWYRKPRFLNRKKNENWLAPSIQHKLNTHIKLINKVKEILPISHIIIEVAAFDIQKIKNPEISGVEYQKGCQAGFWNVREYVLYRDNHTCQHCKGKSKDKILEVHHIRSRQVGGDSPNNLVTLCSACHDKVSQDKIKFDIKPLNGFKAETFMSIVRWKLINTVKEAGENTSHTYGYITKSNRILLGLSKSHINDAFIIAGGNGQKRNAYCYLIQQVRKCNRKLFKGDRSHIKNTAQRVVHGFQRFDKVLWKNVECFVFGRRTSGYFELRKIDGTKIHASAKAKELTLLERAKTLLIERRGAALLPHPMEGASEPKI